MAYLDENGLEHFWGKIKDHVDSAVAPKADDADVLHKTGTEAISGEKVFSGSQTTPSGNASALIVVKDPNLVKGETPAANHFLSLGFIDSTGDSYAQDAASRLAVVEYKSPSEADPEGYMQLSDMGFNGGGSAVLRVGHDKDNIRYATAPATSDDRTNSTDIVTRGYMEASEWNWQKTKKAGVVAFKPVPESDLESVVDFMFAETPPASGDKGPENPSTITGVTQAKVTRCGKNLLSQDFNGNTVPSGETVEVRGITYVNFNGTYAISGTASSGISSCLISGNKELYLHSGTYYLSGFNLPSNGPTINIQTLNNDGTVKSTIGFFSTAAAITITDDTQGWANVYFRCADGKSYPEGYTCSPQLELGSAATAFEPGVSNVFTISLGDTYYGGSLDVATGVMTVTHVGESVSGFTEVSNIDIDTVAFNYYSNKSHEGDISPILNFLSCNRFQPLNSSADVEHCRFGGNPGSARYSIRFWIDKSRLDVSGAVDPSSPTSAEWLVAANAWLASNPVFVCYKLFTLETVQLTPTQIRSLPALDKYEPRVNTVYTDQEAVQVGYQRYVGDKFRKNVAIENTNPTLYLDGSVDSVRDDIQFRVKNQQGVKKVLAVIRLVPTGTLMIGRASDPDGYWYDGANISMFKSGGMSLYVRNNDGSKSHTLGLDLSGSLLWDGQEVQITSDERCKTSLTAIPDAVLDAWEAVQWGQFKFLDAVAEKGEDAARLHLGLIAQRVKAVFEAQGLDACQYGILCHEEHEATDEKPAVDLWMVRYAEAQAMEACCMRRENARLKKRVADLEERLAALELKIS